MAYWGGERVRGGRSIRRRPYHVACWGRGGGEGQGMMGEKRLRGLALIVTTIFIIINNINFMY